MMKKMLIWLLAIILCLGAAPSFAEDVTTEEANVELAEEDYSVKADIASDESYEFDSDEIAEKFSEATDGLALYYIKFDDVDVEGGTLLYGSDRDAVKKDTSYYVEKNPKIENIKFVPDLTYDGTTEINYKAYKDKNNYIEGKIVITVTKAESGDLDTITYSKKPGKKLSLSSGDIRRVFKKAGGALSYIAFSVTPNKTTEGTLYYNYGTEEEETVVKNTKYYDEESDEDILIDNITFVISDKATKNFNIKYLAYDEDGNVYDGIIKIELELTAGGDGIHYEVTGRSKSFVPKDFNDECIAETNNTLWYVVFEKPSNGALYYLYGEDGEKKAGANKYYYDGEDDQPELLDISYVPNDDFIGKDSVSYKAYNIVGKSFEGTVNITVIEGDGEELGDIEYSVEVNGSKKFSAPKFNSFCKEAVGEELDYVKFELPPTSKGTLYYDYNESDSVHEKVLEDTKYYKSSSSSKYKSISNISFVPKGSSTGKVSINYFGYTVDKTAVEGKVVITVNNDTEVAQGDIDTIVYKKVKAGEKVKIDAKDIKTVCNNANIDFSYIKFKPTKITDLYTIKSGTSDASTSTKYYKDSDKSTNIEKLSVEVDKKASGNFDVCYTAYVSSDEYYSGIISFMLDAPEDDYEIYYEVTGESVLFKAADFRDICEDELGTKLSYVKFTPPSDGELYYDYFNEDGDRAKVTAKDEFNYQSYPYLYNVSYVPEEDYKGYVEIDYEGVDKGDDSFYGTVTIYVNTSDVEEASEIDLGSIKNTSSVKFSDSKFKSASKNATGETLSYIKIDLPSSSKGTLYYNYSSSKDENEEVTEAKRYFLSKADYIKNVTFVPKAGSKGKVSISYTGFTEKNTRFTGNVIIEVTATTTVNKKDEDEDEDIKTISYKGEIGASVKFDEDDFYNVCDDYYGDDLESIMFTIPTASNGVLYYDGKTKIEASDEFFYEGDDELISKVSFVPAKSGTINIKYTAFTVEGDEFEGKIAIKVDAKKKGIDNFTYKNMYNVGEFTDIDENAWYGSKQTGAVKLAYRYGLMKGRGAGVFDPSGNMTVAEALTIAARIHDIYYNYETEFENGEPWYEEYVTYAINEEIIDKGDFTNYEKKITREEMAYIFANILPKDELEELNFVTELPDVDEDNKYYEEIFFLYNTGLLRGNDDKGTFNPKAEITRAEVSAIIVRIVDAEERLEF